MRIDNINNNAQFGAKLIVSPKLKVIDEVSNKLRRIAREELAQLHKEASVIGRRTKDTITIQNPDPAAIRPVCIIKHSIEGAKGWSLGQLATVKNYIDHIRTLGAIFG